LLITIRRDIHIQSIANVVLLDVYFVNKTIRVVVARPVSHQHKESIKSNIYIAGVPKHWSKTVMDDYFGMYGRILESRVLVDHAGISRGIGFVRYEDASQAAKAILHTNNVVAPGGMEAMVVKYARDSSSRGWPGGVPQPTNGLDVPPPVLFTVPPTTTTTVPPLLPSSSVAASSAATAAAASTASSSHLSVPRPTPAGSSFTSLPSYPPLSPASHYGAGQASPDEYYRHLNYYHHYQNVTNLSSVMLPTAVH
jgi:hypothetical protein